MEVIIWPLLVASLLAILFWPTKAGAAPKKFKKYRASGAVLFGLNEVFQPSAANASLVQEEIRESRRALPSPEDKP